MTLRSRRGSSNFLAMSVQNNGFLLDRLGQDCHPVQYLRELTQNSGHRAGLTLHAPVARLAER